jgi:hypothetical protein
MDLTFRQSATLRYSTEEDFVPDDKTKFARNAQMLHYG